MAAAQCKLDFTEVGATRESESLAVSTGFGCDNAKFLQRPSTCFHDGPIIPPCRIGDKCKTDLAESWFKEGYDFENACKWEVEGI